MASLVAVLVVFAMTPVYRASVTILIESEPANVISIEEVYGLDTQTQQYFATQFEILNSRPLVEDVVAALGLDSNPEFTDGEQGEWLGIDWRTWFPIAVSNSADKDRSAELEHVIETYYEKLTIEPLRATQLVTLHFDSEDPALAAGIANRHAQAYIQSMLGARAGVTDSAEAWMSERLEGLRNQLQESEQKLQKFREDEQLIDVEGLKALPAKEINELTLRLVAVRRELSQARIAYSQAYAGGARPLNDLSGIPAILEDKGVQELQKAEAQAQLKVAELAKRYGPEHPKMIAARSELAEATANLRTQRQSVAESIRNKFDAARREEAELVRALDRAKQQYQEIGRKESELAALQREGDTNRNLYDLFYNRISETAAAGDLESAPARIISPAVVPSKPDKPRKVFVVSLIFVLSLVAGTTAALLMEAMNNTVRGVADVEEKLRLPLLGMVPLLRARRKNRPSLGNVFFDKAEPRFNEAIRTVRTSISLDNLERPHGIIVVTSSMSDEGKTIVALNLAHAFGQSENVLLVEADMRRPSIRRELKLPGDRPGLSELLLGKAKLSQCIFRGGKNRMDVMLSGKCPQDPAQLLSSERLVNALLVLRKHYDRIIIDTPPVLPISDALVLSRQADSVVFVAKSEATSMTHIRQALEMLLRANARVSGIVVNQLDTRKAGKYSNYGYGGYYEAYDSTVVTS